MVLLQECALWRTTYCQRLGDVNFRRGLRSGGKRSRDGEDIFGRDDWPQRRFRPKRLISKQPRHKLRVQSVAGFVGFHSRENRQPDKSQVADQVERLVATEFV